jgi:hypothetical protein
MLPEWLESLLTSQSSAVRALGYLRELRNIRRRYRFWRSEWEPHCEHTRAILRAAAGHCPQRRKALVVGSGYLHDVPLPELAAAFAEVILLDVLHPLATRWAVRRHPNVRLLSADVTGTLEDIRQAARSEGSPLPRSSPDLFLNDQAIDLVASVNVLSQLPCMPERYLLDAGSHSQEEIVAYARDVIGAHLVWLRRFGAVVALVADVEALTISTEGEMVRRSNTLYGLAPDWQGETWTWPLVPCSSTPPYQATHLRVVGTVDLRSATKPVPFHEGPATGAGA